MKKKLQLKCLKKISAKELTAANKQTGENDSSSAASESVSEPHGELHVFTDEKLFTVAAPTNSQNDRFYVCLGTRKNNVNKNRLLRTRSTFNKSVGVGGHSTDGCRTRSLTVNSSVM